MRAVIWRAAISAISIPAMLTLSTVSLVEEGRELHAIDVSSEKYSVLVTNQQPEWAEKSDQEKARALMIRALREDEVLRAALREVLRD
ncbi:MAG: hypothetical protein ACE5JL_17270 [Dehalococcoidia bacterium]